MTRQRNQYMATIQVTWSKVTVWNTQFEPSRNGAAAAVSSAIACSPSEPPSRRTYTPESVTRKPPNSDGSNRSVQGLTPRSAVSSRASSGTIGGKSTYPNDGCQPESR